MMSVMVTARRCWIVVMIYWCAAQPPSSAYGLDGGGACGRRARGGRPSPPPCDLAALGYCADAGDAYPWAAVRRFVRDNHGLMRRMYGDQRHGHVLRVELEEEERQDEEEERWMDYRPRSFARYQPQSNTLENELEQQEAPQDFLEQPNPLLEEARFLREDVTNDDVLNTKFIFSEQPAIAIKLAALKTPYFRPTSQKTPYLKTRTTTTEENDIVTIETTTATTTTLEPTSESTTDSTTEQPTTSTSKYQTTTKGQTTKTTDKKPTTKTTQQTSGTTSKPTTKLTTKLTTVQEQTTTTTTEANQNSIDRIGETAPAVVEEVEGLHKDDPSGSDGDKGGTMLFQDMEEDETKKKHYYNYKLKGINACPVKEEVVAPFWANNTRGEVLALLNMYPFEQYVHWEKCTFEHRQMYCREGCRCEQQYRLHRLLAYDPNNECRGIFSDWFKFPSCCICKCYDIPPDFRVTSRSPRFQQISDDFEID